MNSTNETKMDMKQAKQNNTPNIRWTLVGYDLIVYALVAVILLVLYGGMDKLSTVGIFQQVGLSVLCIFTARLIGKIYGQVWRYGGIQCYIRLLFTDSIAFVAYLCLELLLPVQKITFARLLSLVSLNLLGALALRMMYRYAYKCGNQETTRGKILSILLHVFSGIEAGNEKEVQKIKVAIIGAGRVGVSLAEELLNNSEAAYVPRCFIDINKEKVGRDIHGIPVWSETEATFKKLGEFEVQEIIFAIPSMDNVFEMKEVEFFEYYNKKKKDYSNNELLIAYRQEEKEILSRMPELPFSNIWIATDEYALAKARQENILLTTNKKNWTIIRPYKTYNNNRLQLGMYEKEEWLYRLMMGKTLVFPTELKKRKTTLTCPDEFQRNKTIDNTIYRMKLVQRKTQTV